MRDIERELYGERETLDGSQPCDKCGDKQVKIRYPYRDKKIWWLCLKCGNSNPVEPADPKNEI